MAPLVSELRWSQAVARARYRVPQRWMAHAMGKPAICDAMLALLRGEESYKRAFWQMPLQLAPTLWPRNRKSATVVHRVDGA